MTATVLSLPPSPSAEATDFLRRLAAMMSGGRNSEMLLQAAGMIESLAQRATSAEQLYHDQHEASARNLELRQVAELAADKLLAEAEALRAQLAENARQAEAERIRLEEEARQLTAKAENAEARLAEAAAELDALQNSIDEFNETVVTAPIQALRLARTQFDFLADGFARSGDVISQTICEIGGCAIDQALAGEQPDST